MAFQNKNTQLMIISIRQN